MKKPVLMQIQEELNEGIKLGATSAGAIITEELERLQWRHKREMDAVKANDEALRARLAEERQVLAQKKTGRDCRRQSMRHARTWRWKEGGYRRCMRELRPSEQN